MQNMEISVSGIKVLLEGDIFFTTKCNVHTVQVGKSQMKEGRDIYV